MMSGTNMRSPMDNTEFIEAYFTSSGEILGILPHERSKVTTAMAEQEARLNEVVKAKVNVTGGDDWHDGAFRATDGEANVIRERMQSIAPFMTALIVDYPEPTELRVTLGSRVSIKQNNTEFPVDIVGYKATNDTNIDPVTGEEIMNATLGSPLAKALIGKMVETEVSYKIGERTINATIHNVDQEATKKQYWTH